MTKKKIMNRCVIPITSTVVASPRARGVKIHALAGATLNGEYNSHFTEIVDLGHLLGGKENDKAFVRIVERYYRRGVSLSSSVDAAYRQTLQRSVEYRIQDSKWVIKHWLIKTCGVIPFGFGRFLSAHAVDGDGKKMIFLIDIDGNWYEKFVYWKAIDDCRFGGELFVVNRAGVKFVFKHATGDEYSSTWTADHGSGFTETVHHYDYAALKRMATSIPLERRRE